MDDVLGQQLKRRSFQYKGTTYTTVVVLDGDKYVAYAGVNAADCKKLSIPTIDMVKLQGIGDLSGMMDAVEAEFRASRP